MDASIKPSMIRLDLSDNNLDIASIRAICHSSILSQLKLLKMARCGLTSEALCLMMHSENLAKVEVLLLPNNNIDNIKGFYITDDKTPSQIRCSAKYMKLKVVDLRGNLIKNIY